MKKRLLATLLAICMAVTLIPAFVIPAAAAEAADYTLYLNDADGKLYKNYVYDDYAMDEVEIAGAEVGGNPGSRILTLTNLDFETSSDIALRVPAGTTIVLEGNNAIASTFSEYGGSYGLYAEGLLKIDGSGSLTVTGGLASYSIGIDTTGGSLEVSNKVTINATGRESQGSSCGIRTGSITISDRAAVNAAGGTAYTSTGISSNGNLIVNDDATLTATGSTATGDYSYGIFMHNGNTIISGNATLTATGGSAPSGLSYGLFTTNDITIRDNASLTAMGGKADGQSTGIDTFNDITISNNAKLTATGSTVAVGGESIGLFAHNNDTATVTINDSAVLTAIGGTAPSGFSYGIYSHDTFRISGSAALVATGGMAQAGQSFGIITYSDNGTFSLSGNSAVTATGGTAIGGYSYGIFSYDDFIISDNATLTTTGGDALSDGSCGFFSNSDLIISGGTFTAAAKAYAIEINYAVPSGYKYTVSANKDGTDPTTGTSDGNFVLDYANAYKYTKIEAPFTSNKITVADTKYGKVSVNNNEPINGQNIIVTVSPEDGYELYSLVIAQASGNRLPYTDNGNGTYTFKFTSGVISILAKFKVIIDPSTSLPFTDVNKSDWFYSDIQYVYAYELFNGITDTIFEPNTPMTRGMIVTVLGRLAGINPDNYTGTNFDDVNADAYYTPYINWASENGIVYGVDWRIFKPDEKISRQDLATIIHRYSISMDKRLPIIKEASDFNDSHFISDHASYAVYVIQGAGIINGKPGNIFDPLGNATRAEVAAMLHRFTDIVGME